MRAAGLAVLLCGVGLVWAQPARIRCGPAQAGCGPASVLVTATTLPPAGYADVVRVDAPILYYRFGESSGTTAVAEVGGNGTYNGALALGQPGATADGNTAVRLDGVDDTISLPSSLTLPAGSSITVEWWQYLVPSDAKQSGAFEIGPGAWNDNSARAHAPWADSGVHWDYGAGSRVSSTYTGRYDKWTLIHMTYDAVTKVHAISFDGVEVTSAVNAATSTIALVGGTIGVAPWGHHKGVLDEFAVYDKVLTPARRLAHFQAASQ
jgi:large repetitive protein